MKKMAISFRTVSLRLFAFAALVMVCFSLSNCQKEPMDTFETANQADTEKQLDVLAKEQPDNFFMDKKQGVPNRYIVMFKESFLKPAELDQVDKSLRSTDATDGRSAGRLKEVEETVESYLDENKISRQHVLATYGQLITGFAATLTEEQVEKLLNDPRVERIEQDMEYVVEDGVVEEIVEEGDRATQVTPCGITRHDGGGASASNINWIWIVDSGIQSNHPDLNVETSPTYAKSFVGGTFEDCNGQGTHVAGIAAAKNNSFGVVGMSPGARVVPIKVFNGCTNPTITNSTLLSALNHIAFRDLPGDVVTLRITGYLGTGCSSTSVFKTAVQNLGNSGTWVIIPAGNNASYAGNFEPGCINGTKILTIANMTCGDSFYSTSNFNQTAGTNPIDWVAVGANVYSTWIGSGYATQTGTAMSAAHVAGIVHWRQDYPLPYGFVYKNGLQYKVPSRGYIVP